MCEQRRRFAVDVVACPGPLVSERSGVAVTPTVKPNAKTLSHAGSRLAPRTRLSQAGGLYPRAGAAEGVWHSAALVASARMSGLASSGKHND